MNAAPEERREVARNLRLLDSASSAFGINSLHETGHDMRQPVASIIVPADGDFLRCRLSTAGCEVQQCVS